MDSPAPFVADGSINNAGLLTGTVPIVELARHDTMSSIESVDRLSQGHWALNLSGNCSSCHHHHRSVQVRVHVSGESTEIGDVYCHRCQRLWLAFGTVNATRLSLLSTKSIEPETLRAEVKFRKTLVRFIKAATPVATLSPTLTVIPEITSAGPSRGASLRSTARDVQRHSKAIEDHRGPVLEDNDNRGHSPGSRHFRSGGQKPAIFPKISWSKGRQAIARLKLKITARLRTSPASSLVTISPAESGLERNRYRQVPAFSPTGITPTVAVSEILEECSEAGANPDGERNYTAPNVCARSATATDALASLGALDTQAIQTLSSQERWEWGRRQLTDFRTLYTGSTAPVGIPIMISSGTQANLSEDSLLPCPPLGRRHSALAFVGGNFDNDEYWDIFHNRPLSVSEANFSDADTAVERISFTPTTHQLLIESMHRDRRGSGSSLPRSLHNIVNDWQQSRRNLRLSIDSAATGGAVRGSTTGRARTSIRLSRHSLGTEPTTSRVHLPVAEETEHSDLSENASSPSPPPTTETDVRYRV
jgi:hypothetical protein